MIARAAVCAIAWLAPAAEAAASGDPTSTFSFLRIREGVRAAAMGDAFSALADDGSAIHWNPAGVLQLLGGQVYAEHVVWFDQTSYDFVQYTHRFFPDALVAGFGVTGYQDTWDSLDRSLPSSSGSGRAYGGYAAFQAAVATRVGDVLDVGVNLKAVRAGLGSNWLTGWGGDAGFLLRLLDDGWTLSLVANDFGSSVRQTGSYVGEFQTFPFSLRVGSSWRVVDEGFKIFTMNLDGEWPMDTKSFGYAKPGGGAGFELWLFKTVALRGGYRIRPSDLPWSAAWTFGGGFHYWIWTFDYAYQPFGELGVVHRASVTLDFRANAWSQMKFAPKVKKVKPVPQPTPTGAPPPPAYATSTPVVVYPTPVPTPPPAYVPPPPPPTPVHGGVPPVGYATPTRVPAAAPPTATPPPRPTLVPAEAISPPTGVNVEREGERTVLTWENPRQIAAVEGYNVYFGSSPSGPWTRLNAAGPVRGNRIPVNIPPGRIAYLAVRTVDASGSESALSEVASNRLSAPTAVVRPPAPTGVTEETSGEETVVTWQIPRNPSITGYLVHAATARGGPYRQLNAAPQASNRATVKTGGVRRYFVVTSVDVNGVASDYSMEAVRIGPDETPTPRPHTATATPKALAPARGVKAFDDKGRIVLVWQLPPGADGANVYAHREGAPYAKVNAEPVRVTRYQVPRLEQGTMYSFVVRAVYGAQESGSSGEVSIFVSKVPASRTATITLTPTISQTPTETAIYFQPPKAPSLRSATGGDRSVALRWAPHPDRNVVGFNVYRSTTPGGGFAKALRRVRGTSATVTGLSNGVTYYFVLTAENAAKQESAFSNEASAAAGP